MQVNDLIAVSHDGKTCIIKINESEIREHTKVTQLAEVIQNETIATVDARVVLDFGEVKFLSSHFLGPLRKLQDELGQTKGKLHLAAVAAPIMEVFQVIGVADEFAIFETVDRAVEEFE